MAFKLLQNRVSKKSDIEFKVAFEQLSQLNESIAPDIMLRLYAFYKQATEGDFCEQNNQPDVRNAFKFNAWMQLSGMTKEKAKKEYISLSKIILTDKIKTT